MKSFAVHEICERGLKLIKQKNLIKAEQKLENVTKEQHTKLLKALGDIEVIDIQSLLTPEEKEAGFVVAYLDYDEKKETVSDKDALPPVIELKDSKFYQNLDVFRVKLVLNSVVPVVKVIELGRNHYENPSFSFIPLPAFESLAKLLHSITYSKDKLIWEKMENR